MLPKRLVLCHRRLKEADWAVALAAAMISRIAFNAVVGRLDGLDGFTHVILAESQVVGALLMVLGSKEIDGVIQGGLNPFAGGQAALG